uniref:Pepsin-I3 domain-containing protein n=1 Tax=Caenorhabditis tropicalis TaxID=1561998 RepID=A0A1I7T2K9_9PELO
MIVLTGKQQGSARQRTGCLGQQPGQRTGSCDSDGLVINMIGLYSRIKEDYEEFINHYETQDLKEKRPTTGKQQGSARQRPGCLGQQPGQRTGWCAWDGSVRATKMVGRVDSAVD